MQAISKFLKDSFDFQITLQRVFGKSSSSSSSSSTSSSHLRRQRQRRQQQQQQRSPTKLNFLHPFTPRLCTLSSYTYVRLLVLHLLLYYSFFFFFFFFFSSPLPESGCGQARARAGDRAQQARVGFCKQSKVGNFLF